MKRVLTGLLLIFLLVVLVVFANPFLFSVTATLIVSLALLEYYRMTISGDKGLLITGTLLGITIPISVYAAGLNGFLGSLTIAALLIFTYCLFIHDSLASLTNRIGIGILGIIYIAVPLSYLILIRELEQGSLWILFLFFIVAANDISAFYVGTRFGKYKLAPAVSPNKTIEGAFGGLIGGIITALLFQQFFLLKASLLETLLLALVIGIVGQLSDLFESLIKRSAGVKDSGNILPGHGGVLDRIDSIIFTAPVLYYSIIIFGI